MTTEAGSAAWPIWDLVSGCTGVSANELDGFSPAAQPLTAVRRQVAWTPRTTRELEEPTCVGWFGLMRRGRGRPRHLALPGRDAYTRERRSRRLSLPGVRISPACGLRGRSTVRLEPSPRLVIRALIGRLLPFVQSVGARRATNAHIRHERPHPARTPTNGPPQVSVSRSPCRGQTRQGNRPPRRFPRSTAPRHDRRGTPGVDVPLRSRRHQERRERCFLFTFFFVCRTCGAAAIDADAATLPLRCTTNGLLTDARVRCAAGAMGDPGDAGGLSRSRGLGRCGRDHQAGPDEHGGGGGNGTSGAFLLCFVHGSTVQRTRVSPRPAQRQETVAGHHAHPVRRRRLAYSSPCPNRTNRHPGHPSWAAIRDSSAVLRGQGTSIVRQA